MVRFVVFLATVSLAISLLNSSKVRAFSEYFFDFSLTQNVLQDGQEITIQVSWNIQDFTMAGQRRFTVRPYISAGAVELYNPELRRFVGMASVTSELPYLQKELLVRFSGVQSLEIPASLHFAIIDTLIGQHYETPVKKVWGTAYYSKYTGLLNESFLETSATDESITDSVTEAVMPAVSKPQDPVKLYLWYLSPALFLYGLLKSPHGFG